MIGLYGILKYKILVVELSMKKLCEIQNVSIKENHNLVSCYNEINNLYDWNKYGLNINNIKDALNFMQDKNQIFRYPYDKKNNNFETVAIHLSDWLYLVHSLYNIIVEEQERNKINAES